MVHGLVTEICVRCAAFGLLRTGKRVELVADAVCALKAADGDAMMQEYKAQGGVLTSAASIL